MTELLPFFLVLFTGVFFPELLRRFHVPLVPALIIGGVVIGAMGFNVYPQNNEALTLLAQIGLLFLMFSAGTEVDVKTFSRVGTTAGLLAFLNGLVPALLGFSVSILLGFSLEASLFMAVIFISSSVAVIVPLLEQVGLRKTDVGKTIIAATVIEDIASLVLLTVIIGIHNAEQHSGFSLAATLVTIGLVLLLARLTPIIKKALSREDSNHNNELRTILVLLLGIVIVFEVLGIEAIIAGFLAGMLLAPVISTAVLKSKLRVLGYGLFIPTFFLSVGAQFSIDLNTITTFYVAAIALTVTLIGTKVLSGYLVGRVTGLNKATSTLVGFITTPQLSTTLAAAYTAQAVGIVSTEIISLLVLLTIVTTLLAPFAVSFVAKHQSVVRSSA